MRILSIWGYFCVFCLLFLFGTTAFAEPAFPLQRLHDDWMMQDHGFDYNSCFSSSDPSGAEQDMVAKVLNELGNQGTSFSQEREVLVNGQVPGHDPRWKDLYLRACQVRRNVRLEKVRQVFPQIVYAKHSVLGGSHYAYTEEPTDAQNPERNHDFKPGGQLCLLSIDDDGQVVSDILYETTTGFLRDPDVSYDGSKIVFSMRNNMETDDFHLYEMDLATKEVRQLTEGLGFADIEPCYLPDSNILFASTRCMQIVDCWWTDVCNFYVIDKDGNLMRRVGFDQVHTNYPKTLEDGRVIYTRWDYNDRGQLFPQPLFIMNYDATGQTEFYGNNSWFPTTIMHARGIPGSQKVLAIASGHHTHQRGKLLMIDRSKGTQEASGAKLIAPPRRTRAEKIDQYGQAGDQFQYPYPLDEENYIVTYSPEGFPGGNYDPPFGIYYMDMSGNRELLAFDPKISSGQPVPLASRDIPQVRASTVDYAKGTGSYYVQDIYVGPGLEGVERGTVKTLRVIALDFRAAGAGANSNGGPAGGALVSTPIACNNGSWDVKTVLGDVAVEADGSVYFEVPARTPLYFQLLDEKGQVVQSMRSWSTLQPGEIFSCIGCHETKQGTLQNEKPTVRTALRKRPQRPKPLVDPNHGFSFVRNVQPIFDAHCVKCHTGGTKEDGTPAPFSLLGNTYRPTDQKEKEATASTGRDFSESYMNLVNRGRPTEIVNWLNVQSIPPMLPPYFAGSSKSKLLTQFEEGHNDVQLSDQEKKVLACWIDLLVPYCGSYTESNTWSDSQKAEYGYYQNKRDRMSDIDRENVLLLVAHNKAQELLELGEDRENVEFPELNHGKLFTAGGRDAKKQFIADWIARKGEWPLFGQKTGSENIRRNVALNPKATQGEATSFPHALTNSEYAFMDCYAAKNVMNGRKENKGHGEKFPSWGPNKRTDLWLTIDFGRLVEVDQVVLYLRADFPHDSCWKSAVLEFSDGSRVPIELKKTAEPQEFTFDKRQTTFVKITDLQEDRPLGWCGLTEVEVWGQDVGTGE